jgi:hypothetical protein
VRRKLFVEFAGPAESRRRLASLVLGNRVDRDQHQIDFLGMSLEDLLPERTMGSSRMIQEILVESEDPRLQRHLGKGDRPLRLAPQHRFPHPVTE